jgi:hypothetical protein
MQRTLLVCAIVACAMLPSGCTAPSEAPQTRSTLQAQPAVPAAEDTCTAEETAGPFPDREQPVRVKKPVIYCYPAKVRKPVIYSYPERATDIDVTLELQGRVTVSDPPLSGSNSWHVSAQPDGTLTDRATGRTYPYLYWEGEVPLQFDMSTGFVVAGDDTRSFFSAKLAALGLTAVESRDFIEYWAPEMERNRYNLVHFEGPAYERVARLRVSPRPDTQIRVFMAYRPLDAVQRVTPQSLPTPPARAGFTLVEWGGAELP